MMATGKTSAAREVRKRSAAFHYPNDRAPTSIARCSRIVPRVYLVPLLRLHRPGGMPLICPGCICAPIIAIIPMPIWGRGDR